METPAYLNNFIHAALLIASTLNITLSNNSTRSISLLLLLITMGIKIMVKEKAVMAITIING
jgi:hypothetical protein